MHQHHIRTHQLEYHHPHLFHLVSARNYCQIGFGKCTVKLKTISESLGCSLLEPARFFLALTPKGKEPHPELE